MDKEVRTKIQSIEDALNELDVVVVRLSGKLAELQGDHEVLRSLLEEALDRVPKHQAPPG